MNVTTEQRNGVVIVHVQEPRLLYPLLGEFTDTIAALMGSADPRIVLDLSAVTSIDSAAVGCLIDLSRQATGAGGRLVLTGLQKRVEAMLAVTGAERTLDVRTDDLDGARSLE